jgi:hypothetical protein
MFRYKPHELDGSEVGEAEYAVLIQPGEIIWRTATELSWLRYG